MNKLIFKAYAALQAGIYSNELEEYLCEELHLPDNFLTEHYYQISEAANKLAKGNEIVYRNAIYNEYLRLLEELDKR